VTLTELYNRTAEMLGRKRLGQDMDNALLLRITAAYNEGYEDLKDDQLVTWAAAGAVPNAIGPHLAALMAFNCTASIHVSNELYQRIVNARNIAKREIRRLVTPKYQTVDDAENF
jgi:hypothetical protein